MGQVNKFYFISIHAYTYTPTDNRTLLTKEYHSFYRENRKYKKELYTSQYCVPEKVGPGKESAISKKVRTAKQSLFHIIHFIYHVQFVYKIQPDCLDGIRDMTSKLMSCF